MVSSVKPNQHFVMQMNPLMDSIPCRQNSLMGGRVKTISYHGVNITDLKYDGVFFHLIVV